MSKTRMTKRQKDRKLKRTRQKFTPDDLYLDRTIHELIENIMFFNGDLEE